MGKESNVSCSPTRDLIDAYLDGELDVVRALDVERHFKECPTCAQACDQRRSLLAATKTAALAFSPPPEVETAVRAAIWPTAEYRRASGAWDWRAWIVGAGCGAVATLLLTVAIPRIAGWAGEDALNQAVVDTHVRSLMIGHLTDVENSNRHVVKPWFNGRLDFSPTVVDVADHGFPLAGGRTDYVAGKPAAVLVYYRAAHPIQLFMWRTAANAATGPQASRRQGYHLIHWSNAGLQYWAVSDLNERELNDFVELIRRGAS